MVAKALLISTGNPNKAVELAELLGDPPWEIKHLSDYPHVSPPEEDGETFEANAVKKARYYSIRFRVHCLAEDSGLVVDALDGGPGVRSARYAGEGCTYADNNAKLLEGLRGVPERDRTARFICCAVLACPDGCTHAETGIVEGRIASECRGTNGFGYDPLFIPEGFSETFGEMDRARKQEISHRARALEKLRAYLATLQ